MGYGISQIQTSVINRGSAAQSVRAHALTARALTIYF